MTYRKSKRRRSPRRRRMSGGRRTKAQMNAARKAHKDANCPAGTRKLKKTSPDGRSCSRPRKKPRKAASGPKRKRRTKAQASAARKAHNDARKKCPPNTRPLKHRTKDGRSCSKTKKKKAPKKKKSSKKKKSPPRKNRYEDLMQPQKVGWGCVKAYDSNSNTNQAQRAKSCVKRPGGTFKNRQLCVEDCYWNIVKGKAPRAWTKKKKITDSPESVEERTYGNASWRYTGR